MTTLKTVHAPAELEGQFRLAEELVARFFAERRADPARGTIEIFGERYVLVRGAALSVEFFALVRHLFGPGREREAEAFARNILFDLAHAIGRSDARNLQTKMRLEDRLSTLAAGPVHFAFAGWASVRILPESHPSADDECCIVYEHPESFEAAAWLQARERPDFPVCIMNAGYSSGWSGESLGLQLVSSELLCRARGDACCRFLMAPPHRIEACLARYAAEQPEVARSAGGFEIPDLFARKRAEEELRQSHGELETRVRERTAELLAANQQLQREIAEREQVEAKLRQAHKLEAIGRLAGGVAHDFNNLMGVILTRGSLLERQMREGAPEREELSAILDAAKRAASLTKQLLAFGRVGTLTPEVLDLNTVVSEMTQTLLPLIGEQIELRATLGPDAGSIIGDRSQLEQVLMNLVVNARDAMPAGGALLLRTFPVQLSARKAVATGELAPGSYVLLSVTDTGYGMDEETISKIFDPFFTTKPIGSGSGLGLSTVYGVVTQCGGGISVLSSLGRGAQFDVYFPRARSHLRSAAPKPAAPRNEPLPGRETVLLVEDQKELRAAIGQALMDLGYRVLTASSPYHALELAELHRDDIALLLTDVVMPRMGGRELAERMRRLAPRARVLFMSGYAADDALRIGILDRAAALLPKPFMPDELAQKIRQVLDT